MPTFGDVTVDPVWADSLGAKTTCCRVETPDTSVCIDPGVAAMQPGYPLPDAAKAAFRAEARARIRDAVERSAHAVVSHYHHDHYTPDPGFYDDTTLWLKNPNRWINDSQWTRARDFLDALADRRDASLRYVPPAKQSFSDPLCDLDHAREKDFGDYQERREELLAKWRERYERRVDHWTSNRWVAEPGFANYADDASFTEGDTTVRFLGPWFHGIEYARTGWVVVTVVETPDVTFLHSSDLQGPVVEDYADRIIDVDPDVLFLDGPATYLLGPMLNRTNLRRSVENAARVVRETTPALAWVDHHLLREPTYRDRTEELWTLQDDARVETVAETRGKTPLVERAAEWPADDRAARADAYLAEL